MAGLPDAHLEQFGQTMEQVFGIARERLQQIQAGVKSESFEALSGLAEFGEHLQLRHSECPQTAKEIQEVEKQVKSKKEFADQIISRVEEELNQMIWAANDMTAPDAGLKNARQTPLHAVSEKTDLIGSCVDDMQDSIKGKTQSEQAQILSLEYESRANMRRTETLKTVRQCLGASREWPYGLEEICRRKLQADLVVKGDAEGKADGKRIEQMMEALDAHIKDLEKKQAKCLNEHRIAREALGQRYKRMESMWSRLKEEIQEYLTESTKTAGLSILEERLDTAKIAAQTAREHALEAKHMAKPAAEALVKQAREGSEKIHSMVKDTAEKLQPRAEVPAQISMQNKEICRLLAEKVEQETECQMRRVSQELSQAEARKGELECVPRASLNQQKQIKLAQLRTKVEQLQSSKQQLSASLSEAKSLQKDAGEQMKKLQELESVGYKFHMDRCAQNAKDVVNGVWSDLPQDEPAERDDVSHTNVAVNNSPETAALAQVQNNQLLAQFEQLKKMLENEQGRRQNLEDQLQAVLGQRG